MSDLALPKLIEHRVAAGESDPITAPLYEYYLAGNGLYVRAKRKEFSVSLPLFMRKIWGLPNIPIGMFWERPRIPESLWNRILEHAKRDHSFLEFKEEVYLIFWNNVSHEWQWRAAGRNSTWGSTVADDSLPEYSESCIELHTHPPGALNFSRADDQDELGKFRIFAILVDVHDKPKIRFRCGVYDQLIPIPAAWVGPMPAEILDLNEIDAIVEMLS